MKYILSLAFIMMLVSCGAQTPKKEFYNNMFKWSITIPENFTHVEPAEWERMQNRGAEAVEKTYDQKVVNRSVTIFVFKSDQLNYFESNYQPFDVADKGDYAETCRSVNQILYGTFKAQMPMAKLDSASSKETISGLTFHTFRVSIYLPNKMVMDCRMYSRLFGNKEFSVNIMTVDKEKQRLLMEAWKQSVFKLK
jgi:hypothetical protein